MSTPNPTDAIPPAILSKLSPDFVDYYATVLSKIPPAQGVTIEQVRAHPEKFRAAIALDSSSFPRVKDYHLASQDGETFPVRVYHPDPSVHGEGPYGVHLNFHGGGFVLGDLHSEAQICLSMCDGAGIVVVDVDYRHCPETIWGKCVQDAWAALNWIRSESAALSINPFSVSIGGISAGAHISIVLQHLARDNSVPLRLCLASVPPSTDGLSYGSYTDSPYPSFNEFAHGPVLPWARIKWFGEHCKLNDIRDLWPDWWLAPIRATNWTGLCDTFIRTGECDPLRDEGEAYGIKLVEGGNKVTIKRYLGAPHTFMYLPTLKTKGEYDADAIKALWNAHGRKDI